jgi:hypothetical protein
MLALFAIHGAILCGCRERAPLGAPDSGPPSTSADAAADASSLEEETPPVLPTNDASVDAGHKTALDATCRGSMTSLLGAVMNPRCAVSEREWEALVRAAPDGEAGANVSRPEALVRQRARRDGDHVVFELVNEGRSSVVLPLRFHPAHPELAFSLLAARPDGAVFELAPPGLDAPAEPPGGAGPIAPLPTHGPRFGLDDAGPSSHVYRARIELLPGGVARANLTIDPSIRDRLDRGCGRADAAPDAGTCLPKRLGAGRSILVVGQLLAPTIQAPPARLDWDVR